jgi:hypothetical protein
MKYDTKQLRIKELQKVNTYKEYENKMNSDKLKIREEYRRALDTQIANKPSPLGFPDQKNIEIDRIEHSKNALIPGVYTIASIGTRPVYKYGPSVSYAIKGKAEEKQLQDPVLYNPITNPIPRATSNPYMIKQYLKSHT